MAKCRNIAATFVVLAGCFTMPIGHAATDPLRVSRAQANYEALRDGRKQMGDLSMQELADVADLDEALRTKQPDRPPPSQRCMDDEVRRTGGAPSQLALRVIAMKCRDVGEGL